MDESRIEALLFERAGYHRRGLADRVKSVDAELEAAGYKPDREDPKRTTTESKPRTRRA